MEERNNDGVWVWLNTTDAGWLEKRFGFDGSVSVLAVEGLSIDERPAFELSDLSRFPELEVVELSRLRLVCERGEFRFPTSIKRLEIRNCTVQASGPSIWFESLRSLEELIIDKCSWFNDELLYSALLASKQVREISLTDCPTELATSYKFETKSLSSLELVRVPANCNDLRHLLSNVAALQLLSLQRATWDDECGNLMRDTTVEIFHLTLTSDALTVSEQQVLRSSVKNSFIYEKVDR